MADIEFEAPEFWAAALDANGNLITVATNNGEIDQSLDYIPPMKQICGVSENDGRVYPIQVDNDGNLLPPQ